MVAGLEHYRRGMYDVRGMYDGHVRDRRRAVVDGVTALCIRGLGCPHYWYGMDGVYGMYDGGMQHGRGPVVNDVAALGERGLGGVDDGYGMDGMYDRRVMYVQTGVGRCACDGRGENNL